MLDFLDGHPLKRLSQFAFIAGVDTVVMDSTGNEAWICRWTISKSGNKLFLPAGYKLVFEVQDDLTGLVEFHIMAQGYY